MQVFSSGPFKCFERIRSIASSISEHFGQLFQCMMCFPAQLGLFLSLINWFFIPIAITPFNILLAGTNLWWLAAILDACFASGSTWIIHNIESFFESIAEGKNGEIVEEPTEDIMLLNEEKHGNSG